MSESDLPPPHPYEAIALAGWALTATLLQTLITEGVLQPDQRQLVIEKTLAALEAPRPDGPEAAELLAARRWLEAWL